MTVWDTNGISQCFTEGIIWIDLSLQFSKNLVKNRSYVLICGK